MNQHALFQLGSRVGPAGVEFKVWAPRRRSVAVVLDAAPGRSVSLTRDLAGYFSGAVPGAQAGMTYRYRLDEFEERPDPYSRFQPAGPHGPSMIVDPTAYRWNDRGWRGIDASRQVVYELHVGTFTPEGTYASASAEFEALLDLGVTSLEILPVNEFEGRFGWGYDGVNWFAPFHSYGTPDDLRRMIDRAHAIGLGVILDVVYNHFGSHGNYLPRFAEEYLDHETPNPWGGSPNYSCAAMRRLAIDNAGYWIREFHFDGLRLDATQNIHDPDHPQLLANIVKEARSAAQDRSIVISGEDYLQRTGLLGAAKTGGPELDQLWNDDFHHASRVALTGNADGYLKDYRGRSQELLSAMRRGYLFQGQYNAANKACRGSPVKAEPLTSFVVFTQNHDQVANTLYGARLHTLTSPGKYRAMTAGLLLGPNTPLLFMGQEFNASSPFTYFADYTGETGKSLWSGRRQELMAFDQYADEAAQNLVLDPTSPETLANCRLDFAERETHAPILKMYKDLLALRRTDVLLNCRPHVRLEGATLSEEAFVLRWYGGDESTEHSRLLLVNLGVRLKERLSPEPLLAPPSDKTWRLAWSSNAPQYGGLGTSAPVHETGWQIDAEVALFLVAD